MCCVAKKLPRTWKIDSDVIDAFEAWIGRTGMQRQLAVQAAIWAFISMSPDDRQEWLDAMQEKRLPPTPSAQAEELGRGVDRAIEDAKKPKGRKRRGA